MMMKQSTFFTCLLCLLAALPLTMRGEEELPSQTVSDGVLTVTVTATGQFNSSYSSYQTLLQVQPAEQPVTTLKVIGPLNGPDIDRVRNLLSETLTTLDLGEARFVGEGEYVYDNVYKADMQDNVVGYRMFNNSSYLHAIVLPAGIKRIEELAFSTCNSLESVTMGNELTYVGKSAFVSCRALSTVVWSASLDSIAEGAFQRTNLTSATLPASLRYIGKRAFYDANLADGLTLSEGLLTIDDEAFVSCKFASLTLPNSLTRAGNSVLSSCNQLRQLHFGSGLKKVPGRFMAASPSYNRYVETVTFAEGVEELGDSLFWV
ncbi:MAG: leucine-rich repeat domain-containing protein, partial [Prevotella sp.]|nr:leucine-rich repeat domain-containing protein [Prevotella sp.]